MFEAQVQVDEAENNGNSQAKVRRGFKVKLCINALHLRFRRNVQVCVNLMFLYFDVVQPLQEEQMNKGNNCHHFI